MLKLNSFLFILDYNNLTLYSSRYLKRDPHDTTDGKMTRFTLAPKYPPKTNKHINKQNKNKKNKSFMTPDTGLPVFLHVTLNFDFLKKIMSVFLQVALNKNL